MSTAATIATSIATTIKMTTMTMNGEQQQYQEEELDYEYASLSSLNDNSTNSTTTPYKNPYYSKRPSSLAVSISDDDGIRSELNRLSLQEELMRSEILNALSTLRLEYYHEEEDDEDDNDDNDNDDADDDDDENLEGVTRSVNFQSRDSGLSTTSSASASMIPVQEDYVPSRLEEEYFLYRPWYAKLLSRNKKSQQQPPQHQTLQEEIEQRKAIVKQELEKIQDGLQDVMEIQCKTQEKLVIRARFQGAVKKVKMAKLISAWLESNLEKNKMIQQTLEANLQLKQKEGVLELFNNGNGGDDGVAVTANTNAPKQQYIARV